MKLVFALAAGVTAFSSNIQIDPKNADNAMGQLQGLMQEAQGKLSHAQHHHEKVVKKLRKGVEKDFKDDMILLEGGMDDYAHGLAVARFELEAAVNASQAELSREKAIPAAPGDWDSPASMEEAKMNALISSAQRTLKHDERHNERDLKEAEEDGDGILEDESTKLSMKLGDMTSLWDETKKAIDDHVADAAGSDWVKMHAKVSQAKLPQQKDQMDRLHTAEKSLQTAEKNAVSGLAAAKAKFTAFLSKATKSVQSKTDKTIADLKAAEQRELDKIDGKIPPKKAVKAAAPVKASSVKASSVKAAAPAQKKAATKEKVTQSPAAPAKKAAPQKKVSAGVHKK